MLSVESNLLITYSILIKRNIWGIWLLCTWLLPILYSNLFQSLHFYFLLHVFVWGFWLTVDILWCQISRFKQVNIISYFASFPKLFKKNKQLKLNKGAAVHLSTFSPSLTLFCSILSMAVTVVCIFYFLSIVIVNT